MLMENNISLLVASLLGECLMGFSAFGASSMSAGVAFSSSVEFSVSLD